jgi:hypothetical protein
MLKKSSSSFKNFWNGGGAKETSRDRSLTRATLGEDLPGSSANVNAVGNRTARANYQ